MLGMYRLDCRLSEARYACHLPNRQRGIRKRHQHKERHGLLCTYIRRSKHDLLHFRSRSEADMVWIAMVKRRGES